MMQKRVPDKFWFPWWPDKWIFGSVRIEFTPAERGIWVDMLSLASKDNGHIRANEETPYPLDQLAGMLIIPKAELDKAIRKFIKNKKLARTKFRTLYIVKWDKYQFTDRHKRRVEGEMSKKEDTIARKEDTILNNNKLDNNKLDNKDKNLANLLIKLIKQNDPKAKIPEKDSSLYVKWVNQMRLCRERDKRSESEVEAAIRFSQEDDFWKGNILSTAKLRKQMATLLHQAQRYQPDETGKAPLQVKTPTELECEGLINLAGKKARAKYEDTFQGEALELKIREARTRASHIFWESL